MNPRSGQTSPLRRPRARRCLLFPWVVSSSYWMNLIEPGDQLLDRLPGAEHRPGIRRPALAGPGGLLGSGGLHLGHPHHAIRHARLGRA